MRPDVLLPLRTLASIPFADWSAVAVNAITQAEDLTSEAAPASDRELSTVTTRLEGEAVLACAGELDPATNPALRRSLDGLLRLAPDRVVVDLSRVSFFDAGAIGELVRARTSSRAAGGELVVRSPTALGRRTLGIVGLTNLIAPDVRPATPTSAAPASSDMSGLLDDRGEELVAAWERACGTDRYGAVPLVFEPTTMISKILAVLDDPSSVIPAAMGAAAATRADETSAATAVMQLWALSDLLHARLAADGTGSEQDARRRLGVEAALAAMASAVLDELEQATLLDPLTGLLNRRALDRDLLTSLAAARRHGQCLSVVMIDVEGLKATNDHFGHAAGDDTLRGVAVSLASALRAGDNAYRIGGDEFVLVLPELCPDDVDAVMERTVVGAQGAFTWGCAWVRGDEDATSDADQAAHLLEQADQRMFDYRTRVRGGHERGDAAGVPGPTPAAPTVELAGRFTAGQRSSVVIDEAKGLIAEHFDVGIAEASVMLRTFAIAQFRSQQATAVALVTRTLDVARLAPHRAGSWTTPRCSADHDPDGSPPARS